MQTRMAFWTFALANMIALVALVCAGLAATRRRSFERHGRLMWTAAAARGA